MGERPRGAMEKLPALQTGASLRQMHAVEQKIDMRVTNTSVDRRTREKKAPAAHSSEHCRVYVTRAHARHGA